MSAPHTYAERVKDTSTTTGTGAFTLSGTAPTDFQTFNAAVGTGIYFGYSIVNGGTGEFEEGEGTLSAATTLVRDRVTASSNSGALVNFSAGTKTVFLAFSARTAQNLVTYGRALAHRSSI